MSKLRKMYTEIGETYGRAFMPVALLGVASTGAGYLFLGMPGKFVPLILFGLLLSLGEIVKAKSKQVICDHRKEECMTTIKECHACGGEMLYRLKSVEMAYKDATRTVWINAWCCTTCDEGVLEGESLAVQEREFAELKNDVDGIT